jgi:hypothetical protein
VKSEGGVEYMREKWLWIVTANSKFSNSKSELDINLGDVPGLTSDDFNIKDCKDTRNDLVTVVILASTINLFF